MRNKVTELLASELDRLIDRYIDEWDIDDRELMHVIMQLVLDRVMSDDEFDDDDESEGWKPEGYEL